MVAQAASNASRRARVDCAKAFRTWCLIFAHSAHRDHPDRRIVITVIGHRDHVSERSDEQSRQEWA